MRRFPQSETMHGVKKCNLTTSTENSHGLVEVRTNIDEYGSMGFGPGGSSSFLSSSFLFFLLVLGGAFSMIIGVPSGFICRASISFSSSISCFCNTRNAYLIKCTQNEQISYLFVFLLLLLFGRSQFLSVR